MNSNRRRSSSAGRIDQLSQALPATNHVAQKLAELERRFASHDLIINFFKELLDQMKETGSLELTEEQHAQLNQWLAEYERIADGGSPKSEIN